MSNVKSGKVGKWESEFMWGGWRTFALCMTKYKYSRDRLFDTACHFACPWGSFYAIQIAMNAKKLVVHAT